MPASSMGTSLCTGYSTSSLPPVNGLRKGQRMAQAFGHSNYMESEMKLLVLVWPSADRSGHLGSHSTEGSSLTQTFKMNKYFF